LAGAVGSRVGAGKLVEQRRSSSKFWRCHLKAEASKRAPPHTHTGRH
jgi:hypothetical protein